MGNSLNQLSTCQRDKFLFTLQHMYKVCLSKIFLSFTWSFILADVLAAELYCSYNTAFLSLPGLAVIPSSTFSEGIARQW